MSTQLVLHDPATYAKGFPHEQFRELRATEPVSWHEHPTWGGYWAIVRHDDVQRVSRDSHTFHNAPHPFIEATADDDQSGASALLISLDAPEHAKMRKLVSRGFTPRRVADLTDRIQARVDALIDALRERDGTADLVEDLALWLPLHVIADMVGVPEEDRRQVFDWTEITFGFDPSYTAEQRRDAAMAMYAYADALCADRAKEPRDDLMSVLLAAEVDGERLTQMQLDLFFLLLQNAGSETTRNLITTGTLVLLEHPDELARLRKDLGLLPTAIEELLRYVTPVMQFTRTAVNDTEIAGQQVKAGQRVLLVYSSANRDELAFDDPDTIDVARQPNDHVAFGAGGPHFCLGASLARLEARIMFEAVLTRIDGLEVTEPRESLPRVHSNLIDGYSHVPVRWDAIR